MENNFYNNLLKEKKALEYRLHLVDALIKEYPAAIEVVKVVAEELPNKGVVEQSSTTPKLIGNGPRDYIMQAIDHYGQFVPKKLIIDFLQNAKYEGPNNFYANIVNYLRALKSEKKIDYVKHSGNNSFTFWGRIEWLDNEGKPKAERMWG